MDIRRMLIGYQVSQALHVAAALNVVGLLDGGPRTAAELAEAAGADPEALYRLLRALARVGVFEERDDGVFALNDGAEQLRRNRSHAAFVGRPYHWDAWSHLLDAVRTGDPAFPTLHGQTAWEYRAEHPDESAIFDAWMTAQTEATNASIVTAYEFSRFAHIVDVGGGRGALLAGIIEAYPGVRGTLFDQEHVVEGVELPGCDVVGGSFFETVPRGGDAYVLKSIIHDWPDDAAIAILRTCAAAMESDARVLLIERDLADPASPWIDLQMLVMLGGRERTADEYAALFRAAGLEPGGVTPAGAGFAVYEAVR